MCITLYALLKVVSCYDLTVLSMSVILWVSKRRLDGVDGCCELYPVLFWIF